MLFSKQNLSIEETKLFSNLFTDYISASEKTKTFYNNHIFKTDFEAFFKNHAFENCNRTVLVESLMKQAKLVENTSDLSYSNISLLKNNNTYTVTTGHQLCLFTGPLYFIYKIISTINLCKTLKANFPDKEFVPVYWMASEDHDFEEINHVNVFGKKLIWTNEQKGSVGDLKTSTLQNVIDELKNILGNSANANDFIQLIESAYLNHETLDKATRFLVNALFGEHGMVILDGNDTELKKEFKEEFTKDIFDTISNSNVNKSIAELEKNYNIQVTPRAINVFYKTQGLRERIEKVNEDEFKVVNTEITFSKNELNTIIEKTPELLSPNVVLRPLYQQKIMPNIAYVGGPGELAYWLEFKENFEAQQITFPILMPRQFALIIDKATQQKMQKLDISTPAVFSEGEDLVKAFVKTQNADINLDVFKKQFESLYANLSDVVGAIDKTLVSSTEAEKQKALNGLQSVEQKINKAFKQKAEIEVNQIWGIKNKLFPNNTPQERYDNVSMYYSKFGKEFISELINELTYDLQKFEYTVLLEK